MNFYTFVRTSFFRKPFTTLSTYIDEAFLVHESTRAQRDCFPLLTSPYNAYPFGVSRPDGSAHGQSKEFCCARLLSQRSITLGWLKFRFFSRHFDCRLFITERALERSLISTHPVKDITTMYAAVRFYT